MAIKWSRTGSSIFAFHGSPRGNEDYYTIAEINEEEYEQIAREYPDQIDADVETAEVSRKKYVRGHSVLLVEWNELL